MRIRVSGWLLAAIAAGCSQAPLPPACGQGDLDKPTAAAMPTPVMIEQARKLGGWRLEPPSGATAALGPEQVWPKLLGALGSGGGGDHELLLGTLTRKPVFSDVLVWVRVTHRRAEVLAPTPAPENMATQAGPDCAFFEVVTAINASSGEVVASSTYASPG